jgi:NAD(P)-dependent dehydrogenase (short-subunit alcohol dehydrogenase family)
MAALPPWVGLTFTSKVHSQPSESLLPASQKLPSPFVVAITGASRNIGAATAKAFAQAGATGLILTGTTLSAALQQTKLDVEAAATNPSLKVTILGFDVADASAAQQLTDAVLAHHGGRLDVLVNNAAVVSTAPSAFGRLADVDIDQIERAMAVNFVGKCATTKALLPLLLDQQRRQQQQQRQQQSGEEEPVGAKTVVNITSAISHLPSRGALGYSISELATNRLTEALAETYGPEGLLAFAVHPGVVATMPPPVGMPPEARHGAVDDVGLCGAFLVWLVKERREWLNGRYLSANWDVGELEKKSDAIVKGDLLKMRMTV